MTDPSRDVTHSNQNSKLLPEKIKMIGRVLINFLRHPIYEMQNLPEWPWSYLIATLISFSITSKLLAGFLAFEQISTFVYNILNAIIIMPFYALILAGLMTLFLYYYFQVFERRTVVLRKLATTVIFSLLPFFIFFIGVDAFQPILFVGFGLSAFLLTIGLTQNFQVERKRAMQIMALIYFTVFFSYLWHRFGSRNLELSQSQITQFWMT